LCCHRKANSSQKEENSKLKSNCFMAFLSKMGSMCGVKELSKNRDIWRMLIAEFVGTMFLVLIGCAACVKGWDQSYSPTKIQVAISFGITIATMVQAIGHVSGGHFNPAVTVAFLVTGKIPVMKAVCYVIAQCLGAISGAASLQAFTPPAYHDTLGVTNLGTGMSPTQGFGVEFFATFTLVLVIFGVCDKNRTDLKGSGPLAIGLSITTAILATSQYTGGSLNPARSLGPAVISNRWQYHWRVYWAGPIVGGVVAALLYQNAFRARSADEEEEMKRQDEHSYQQALTEDNTTAIEIRSDQGDQAISSKI